MSVATDLFSVVGPSLDVAWGAIKPYKEAIFGLLVMLGGGYAALFKGYRGQASRPDEALSRAASASPFSARPVRLATKDRQLVTEVRDNVADLTDAVGDLTRATRSLTREIKETRGDGGGCHFQPSTAEA